MRRRVVGSTERTILPRIPRGQQQARGSYYHLMNRGHNHEVVFPTDQDHAYFLELVDRYRQRFPLRIDHDCLMGQRSGRYGSAAPWLCDFIIRQVWRALAGGASRR
jgi:hypothetical protein